MHNRARVLERKDKHASAALHLVVTSLALLGVTTCREQAEQRPNIVIILADDMGLMGCYGGEIQTPNLDRLAANGLTPSSTIRPVAAPRELLWGLYAHQTGMGWMTAADLGRPGYAGDLNHPNVTIAEVLQQAGYATYMSGKWHLTLDRDMDPEGPTDNWPRQRGFDRYFGILSGGGSYFTPTTLTLDNTRIEVRLLPDGCHQRSCCRLSAGAPAEKAGLSLLPLRCLYGSPFHTRQAGGHREVPGVLPGGLGASAG